ncbi:hypothetical protein EIP86_001955 [Pleurotus ostreatoroseus]|nr:hypothetical protein EIP86_001955 [Pleurotus ostreatoroseus]
MYTFAKDILRGRATHARSTRNVPFDSRDVQLGPNTPWIAYKAMIDIADLKIERCELESELQKRQRLHDTLTVNLESRITASEHQVAALNNQLTDERIKAQALCNERNALQTEFDALSSDLARTQASLQLANTEAEAHRRMAANMNAALATEHKFITKHKSSSDKLIRQLEDSKSHILSNLEDAKQALDTTTSLHLAAETRALDLQRKLDALSTTLSNTQRKEADLHTECQQLRAEIESLTQSSLVFDASAEDPHMVSLDETAFAIELENALLESQAEEEEARHAEMEATLTSQLAAALAEVARLKAREDALVFENATLKTQLDTAVQARNGAIFDVQAALSENTKLADENDSLKSRLEAAEAAATTCRSSANIHLAARDAALQQLDEQREQFETELRAQVEEEEKAHFVMAELNREKRELASGLKSTQDALEVRNRRCEELEREVGAIAAALNGFSSSLPATPLPTTPQPVKTSIMDKENMSMSNKFLSKLSGLRRQNTLPLSSSGNLRAGLSSMQIPDSPSPSEMSEQIAFKSFF